MGKNNACININWGEPERAPHIQVLKKTHLQKIERKVGMEYLKNTNKGSKDGNKGQGSSTTSFCPHVVFGCLFTRKEE